MSNFWEKLRKLDNRDVEPTSISHLIEQSEDCDGFLRERSVRQLGLLGDPAALNALLRRANDWVPQVRVAALEAITRLMVPANAAVFVQHLPTIFHLETCRRASHSALVQDCLKYLCASENSATVIAGLGAADARVRRLCLKVAFSLKVMSPGELVHRAIIDADQAIQQIGASQLLALEINEALPIAQDAITSRSSVARRAAFRLYSKAAELNSAMTVARKFAADDSAMVRESALMWLREKCVDVGEIYMDILNQPMASMQKLKAAILGISEAGLKGYTAQILEHESSPSASVRRAVLIAVVRLDPERSQSACQNAMADVSVPVVVTAYRLLAKLGVRFDAAQLFDLASGERQNITMRGAIGLARQSNKWERLIFLLRIANSKAPAFEFKSELANWQLEFNRSWAAPTTGQLNTLWVLVENQLGSISAAQRKDLLFVLDHAQTR